MSAKRLFCATARALGVAACFAAGVATTARAAAKQSCVRGVVWQPDNATINPTGDWHRLGADTLLVQWTVVDGMALTPGSGLPGFAKKPDWRRIASEPWARKVILGLAGAYSEPVARANVAKLVALSARLATLPTPLAVEGYYFPVEVDPSWTRAKDLGPLLASLPRPLWISVYDSSAMGPEKLADWLERWLPHDVGVFFQDGVGAHGRDPSVAAEYAATLSKRLGPSRLAVVVEAFRPKAGGGFRAATPQELKTQIAALQGHSLFLFDGPHYVSQATVDELACRP
ncbi:hypothetical protein [Methylocella sp.]|uniref:hypothetical protein n=1 Tax=Methylocella sp. TaxID=1978226 RepID=UPI003784CD28